MVAHGWTTAKFPPRERVPLTLCLRACTFAALLFGCFVVLLRFTSPSPSRPLPSPSRMGLYVLFMFSPPLLFSMFSHLWLWASSGAPRRLQAGLWCFFFSFSTHLGQNRVSSIEYRVSSIEYRVVIRKRSRLEEKESHQRLPHSRRKEKGGHGV